MLKVGIFAPYERNETTLAAVQVADWLVCCGIEVNFIAEGKVNSGIHPVWDKKVRKATKTNIYKWASAATHLCWFSPNSYALYTSTLVTKSTGQQRTKHIYFPSWSEWTEEHEFFVLTVDRTICLSRDMSVWLDERYAKEKTKRTWANLVSPSSIVIPKYGLVDDKYRHLLVVLTKSFNLDLEASFIDDFSILLALSDSVKLTFLLDKSLPRPYRQRFSRLKKYFSDRVQVLKSVPYYDYATLARQHDWVYLTSTRYTFGSLLSLLMISSVPVISHCVSPVEAHINDGTTGKLIPCQAYNRVTPVAEVNSDEAISVLNTSLHLNEVALKTFQHNILVYLERKQSAFRQFILKEFVQ